MLPLQHQCLAFIINIYYMVVCHQSKHEPMSFFFQEKQYKFHFLNELSLMSEDCTLHANIVPLLKSDFTTNLKTFCLLQHDTLYEYSPSIPVVRSRMEGHKSDLQLHSLNLN